MEDVEPKNTQGAWPTSSFHRNIDPREFIRSLHKKLHANIITEAMFMMGTNWKNWKCPTFGECLPELRHKHMVRHNAVTKNNISDFFNDIRKAAYKSIKIQIKISTVWFLKTTYRCIKKGTRRKDSKCWKWVSPAGKMINNVFSKSSTMAFTTFIRKIATNISNPYHL